MSEFLANAGLFLLPYAIVLGVGYVIGFMSRNSKIDSLMATIKKQQAELNGEEIRTSRYVPGTRTAPESEPVRPVQPRTRPNRTGQPMYGPAHSAARTEPLPTGVRYVAPAEDDEPVSDRQYVELFGQSHVE